ncbi:prepilin-type N-terminal cleavage/methylation domain-containing protein [Colwelliaceae bacterium 6471]
MNKSKGFTLVEVLIAAVILFSALAITADLYKASSFSANKITQKARYYQATPIVISTIKAEITALAKESKQPSYNGQFYILGMKYNWSAERIAFQPRVKTIDDVMDLPSQFGLYRVNISLVKATQPMETYTIKVATW